MPPTNFIELIVPALQALSAAGITPSSSTTYQLSDIQNALSAAHGGHQVRLGCSNGELNEVWYFFNVKGNAITGEYVATDTGTSRFPSSTTTATRGRLANSLVFQLPTPAALRPASSTRPRTDLPALKSESGPCVVNAQLLLSLLLRICVIVIKPAQNECIIPAFSLEIDPRKLFCLQGVQPVLLLLSISSELGAECLV